jgi:SAM-dependent methyltransferase
MSEFPCRVCGSNETAVFLDLGMMPPSDAMRTEEDLGKPEKRYPLKAMLCSGCSLVQITETVPPEELFGDKYIYFSSFSDQLLEHSRKNVEAICASRDLGENSLVVELASNDGYLLQYYDKQGIPVLGIDPAPNQAKAANDKGIETLCEFFGQDLADKLRSEGRMADVVHANNVLAHVADTNGFVQGIATILKDDGVAVFEFPYLRDLIQHCEFDTIYHEHLCYFSVHALVNLFERHGLSLNDLKHLDIHGGSLRIFVGKKKDVQPVITEYLEREKKEGMTSLDYYRDFADRVANIKKGLLEIIETAKKEGKSLAGYGAAAKGTILLNYVGIGPSHLDFIVDRNTHKHGRYMPGVEIPITKPEVLLEKMPDMTLLLPWNFKDEILAQQSEYRDKGGKFIIPIPEPTVV